MTKAIYEEAARAKGQPVFSVTLADFFNAPSVDEIDLSHYAGQAGNSILIRAHDDFEVTSVSVEITDTNGGAIESGAAGEKPAGSGHWTYTATQAVPTGKALRIAVTATDTCPAPQRGARVNPATRR